MTGSSGWNAYAETFGTIWTSGDALNWRVAAYEGSRIANIGEPVGTATGFVVPIAGHLQHSTTGEDWAKLDDPDLDGWSIYSVASSPHGLVAFGSAGATIDGPAIAWTSVDGLDWVPNADPDAQHVARGLLGSGLASLRDEIWAFVAANESEDWQLIDVVEVWRSGDGVSWSKAGELPDSAQIFQINGFAATDDRLLAVSVHPPVGWYSEDGLDWHMAPRVPTQNIEPEFFALAATDSAFVATSGRYPPSATGIFNEENVTGLTWVSSNGRQWDRQSTSGWDGREIDLLLTRDEHLVGIGRDHFGWPEVGAIWSAPFPDLT